MLLVDYRDEIRGPDKCPVCGAEITREQRYGTVSPGPGDREWARQYGVEDALDRGETVETTWWEWRCSVDLEHESGPILIA